MIPLLRSSDPSPNALASQDESEYYGLAVTTPAVPETPTSRGGATPAKRTTEGQGPSGKTRISAAGDGPALVSDAHGAQADIDAGCGDAQVAQEKQRCDQEAANAARQERDLETRLRGLRAAIYRHNLKMSSYEQRLARFDAMAATFTTAVTMYVAAIAGLSYATTATEDWANQLDLERQGLSNQRTQLNDEYLSLRDEAEQERAQLDQLQSDIKSLISQLVKLLAAFVCIQCTKLGPVIAQLDHLLQASNLTVRNPPGVPAALPWVPHLPMPPAPPPPVWRPGPGPRRSRGSGAPGTLVANVPPVIYAGEAFPNTLPIEGGPRVCIGQVWWGWRAGWEEPSRTFRSWDEGIRAPRNLFTFQREPTPTVRVDGALDATNVYVSADCTRVYFTLHNDDVEASEGEVNVTVTDATGTVIHLRDPRDPSPQAVTYTTDLEKGLAALQGSLAYIAVDSCFDAARGQGAETLRTFHDAFGGARRIFDEVLTRMMQRTDPDPSSDAAAPWLAELHPAPPVLALSYQERGPYAQPNFTSLWAGPVQAWYDALFSVASAFSPAPGSPYDLSHPISDTASDIGQMLNRINLWASLLNLFGP